MGEDLTYEDIKVPGIGKRYVCRDHILPFINSLKGSFQIDDLGSSVQGETISGIRLGRGSIKVLMWSQMHGNESTTTRGVLDVLKGLVSGYSDADKILQGIQLFVIPILNPDGAKAYTRENANGLDLNRDARVRTQPESAVLREVFEKYKPDFCFNLHDQRTIFSAGPVPKPATLSFLSPSADESRSITASRLTAMKVISAMSRELHRFIPGQIGRYDDGFNPNCVGDAFQMLDTPTVLVEAGHYPGDYQREETRRFVFLALWKALRTISSGDYAAEDAQDYHAIPENEKRFFDLLVKNVQHLIPGKSHRSDMGILFKEVLEEDTVQLNLHLEREGDLNGYFGHKTFDCAHPDELQKLRENSEVLHFVTEQKR